MNTTTDARPAVAPSVDANALIVGVPIYLYINFPPQNLEMKKLIPAWLRKKTMENTTSASRKKESKDQVLFEGKSIDVLSLADDLSKLGIKPTHIHMMKREHHGVRIRITWEAGKPALPDEEVKWILYFLDRFYLDVKSYRSLNGTTHLPPHISVHGGNPTERDQAMSAQSVQVFQRQIALVTD